MVLGDAEPCDPGAGGGAGRGGRDGVGRGRSG